MSDPLYVCVMIEQSLRVAFASALRNTSCELNSFFIPSAIKEESFKRDNSSFIALRFITGRKRSTSLS